MFFSINYSSHCEVSGFETIIQETIDFFFFVTEEFCIKLIFQTISLFNLCFYHYASIFILENRLSLRIYNHVQWTWNRLGQRAWSTLSLARFLRKYKRSIVKKSYSIFLDRYLNFIILKKSKYMYSIWRDQARGWTWMLGQGTPAGTRHRPAQNSTLGMIGFESN